MDLDAAHQPILHKHPDLGRLPKVLDVHIGRRHFETPRRITEQGRDRPVSEAVELVLRLSEPFQIRALNPVVWVGDEPLTVAEMDEPTVVRFLGFAPEALRRGAPIALSWNATNAPRLETGFSFDGLDAPAAGLDATT